MRVLVISTYFAPEVSGNAPFVTGVVDHLAEVGHDVTVITGFPHYPDWRPLARRRILHVEHRGRACIIRRAHFVPRSPRLAARVAYESALLVGALPVGLARRPPDVILGFSPALSDAVATATIGKALRRPFALVFQDLFAMAATEVGDRRVKRAASLIRALEHRLAAAAAAVGYVSDAFAEHLPQGESSIRLHNWSQLGPPKSGAAETRRHFGWGDKQLLVHAGNMGEKQGLEVVLEAAAIQPAAQFVFVGDGHQRRDLEQRSEELGLTNVSFLGLLSDEQHASVVCAADALLLVQKKAVRQMSLPSKLQTYLDARRPIVACVAADSETAAVLRGTSQVRLVRPGDASALARAIEALPEVPQKASGMLVSKAQAFAGYDRLLEIAGARSSATAVAGATA